MATRSKTRTASQRLWRLSAFLLVLALALMAGLVSWTSLRGLNAPPRLVHWAEAQVNARLAPMGAEVSFDGLTFDLRAGLVPAVVLEDLSVHAQGGTDNARINRAEIVLSRDDLLRGRADVTALRLDGVALDVVRAPDGGLTVDLGGAPLAEDAENPAELVDQLRARLDQGRASELQEVGVTGLSLTVTDASAGQALRTTDGTLRLSRDGAALSLDVDLGQVVAESGGRSSGVGSVRAGISSAGPSGAVSASLDMFGLVPAELAGISGSAPLADLLGRLDAPVAISLAADLPAAGGVRRLDGSISVGEGTIRIPGRSAPVGFQSVRADLAVSPDAGRVSLTDIVLSSPELSLSGRLTLLPENGGGGPFAIEKIIAQMSLDDLTINRPDFFAGPLDFDAVSADVRYDRRGDRVDIGALDLTLDGETLRLSGKIGPPDAEAEGAAFNGRTISVDLASDALRAPTVFALWPKDLIEGSRSWLARNLLEGTLHNVSAAVRLAPDTPPDIGLAFTFDNGKLHILNGMPDLTDAHGRMTIDGIVMTVAIDAASMQTPMGPQVDLSEGVVRISDIRLRNPLLEVAFTAKAGAGPALSLFTLPAFRGGKAPEPGADPITPEQARGTVVARAELGIPMRKATRFPDVSLEVSGAIYDFDNDSLVPGRDLQAERLTLHVDKQKLEIQGAATLDGAPLDITYFRAFEPLDDGKPAGTSIIRAGFALSESLLNSFDVPLGDVELTGAGASVLSLDLEPGAPPVMDLSVNLEGLGVTVPQVGWSKSPGTVGELSAAGTLGEVVTLDRVVLEAPDLSVTGRLNVTPSDGQIGEIDISRLELGDWLSISVDVTPPPPGGAAIIDITGGWIDMRHLPQLSMTGGQGGRAPRITIALDRVVIAESIALTSVTGRMTGGRVGNLTGRLNGAAPVRVEFSPGSRRGTSATITSDNAGQVLEAAGLGRLLRGGNLEVRLEPHGTGHRGRVRVRRFSLHDTPAVIEIVSALSVVGAFEQARGQGIVFDDARAEFRLNPGRLTLMSASAEGPSLGVSMDGTVDLEPGRLDLQGVVSPIFFLNRMGDYVSRRGEGLIGVTFQVTGTQNAPRVSVNPLSALTPGRLRELFRRPVPTGP
ncbi:MAG: AsmA-like C-terminal region-containing protein [Pseudomonadota bacterium]